MGKPELLDEEGHSLCRECGGSYDWVVAFDPARVVGNFYLAHTLNHWSPEIAERNDRLPFHDSLVDHFPDDGKFDERARSSAASHICVAATDQFEEPLLPRVDGNFFVHPLIRTRAKEFRGDSQRFASGILAPRDTASITPP